MKNLFPSLLSVALSIGTTSSFSIQPSLKTARSSIPSQTRLNDVVSTPQNESTATATSSRRHALTTMATSTLLALTITLPNNLANAAPIPNLPSVTLSEFEIILKDSAKSILVVELSGVKSETALVKLVDGTQFSISDLVESSVDPRSPLKLVARCRLYKVPIKQTALNGLLSGDGSLIGTSGKKKKVYMNERVAIAAEKEKEKKERMEEDERDRLAELYEMEGKERGFLAE